MCQCAKKDKKTFEPEIDICAACKEHAGFDEDGLSECCGSSPINVDVELEDR